MNVKYEISEMIDSNDRLFYQLVKIVNSNREFIIETRSLTKLFIRLHECLRPI